MPVPPQDYFKIIWSDKNRETVRTLGKKANQLGLKKEFLQSINEITKRLTADPLDWGDPLYRLKAMDLILCHGISSLLYIFFGVDEDRRLVFVQDILPMPGFELDE